MKNLLVVACLGLALGACAKKAAPTNTAPEATNGVVLTSAEAGGGHCSAKKADATMASADGSAKHCATPKTEAEMAACKMKKTDATMASAHSCDHCDSKKADGSCDHEAGAKAGHGCCKAELAAASK